MNMSFQLDKFSFSDDEDAMVSGESPHSPRGSMFRLTGDQSSRPNTLYAFLHALN